MQFRNSLCRRILFISVLYPCSKEFDSLYLRSNIYRIFFFSNFIWPASLNNTIWIKREVLKLIVMAISYRYTSAFNKLFKKIVAHNKITHFRLIVQLYSVCDKIFMNKTTRFPLLKISHATYLIPLLLLPHAFSQLFTFLLLQLF